MKACAATALALLVLGQTAVAAQTWNMATPDPDGNYHTENIRQFAAAVDEATGGELAITVHSNASLFKAPEIKRAVQSGQVQLGEIIISSLANEDALYEVDAVPFLANGFDAAAQLYQITRPYLEERLQKQGMRLLFSVPWPPQGFYTLEPAAKAEDFEGVKMRAYNAPTTRLVELLGAVPTTIQAAEVPQAFAAGVISAMVTSPQTGVDSQAWDFVKNYYDVQAFIPKNMVFVNERAFKRLDEAQQQAVLDAAAAAEKRGWETARSANDRLVATLKEKGMSVQPPSPELAAELAAIGAQMAEEWRAKAGEDGAKILAEIKG